MMWHDTNMEHANVAYAEGAPTFTNSVKASKTFQGIFNNYAISDLSPYFVSTLKIFKAQTMSPFG